MNFVVILIGFQLTLQSSASFFDWPLGGNVRPVYRRLKSDGLRQIYQSKSLNFDTTYQKAAGVPKKHPSMYYDASWPDWRQNALQHNIQDSILLPWSHISVTAIKNPILVPGGPDPYAKVFKDRNFIPPEEESDSDWKVGPVEVKNGQIRFSL